VTPWHDQHARTIEQGSQANSGIRHVVDLIVRAFRILSCALSGR